MTPEERARLQELRAKRDAANAPQQSALSEQDRARLAELRAKRDGTAPAAPAAPPMSTRATEQFPPQEGLSVPAPYPQRAGDLQGVRDYLSQSQAEDDARAAEREALRKRAAEAGRAETLRGLQSTSPMAMGLGGPSATLAGQSASDQVYGEAGVMSPEAAREVRSFNSRLLGLPGILNEDVREKIGQAGQDQPGMALLGDIEGYFVPGEAAFQVGKGVTNAFARPIVSRIMPQGGSAIERGTRFAGRYGTQTGAWAGQNALYQGTVGESVRAAEEGRAPTLANAAGGAVTGATDWLNLAGPAALMGLNRAAQWVRTGGLSATPDDVARSVSVSGQATNDARLQATSVLDMDLAGSGLRPQAIDRVVRELQSGGLSREDVAGLFEAVNQRLSSLPEGQSGRLTVGQAMIEALERDFPQAAENILGTLRERRLSARKGDRSAGIAGQVSRELRNTQGTFLGQSVDRNLGNQRLSNIDDEITQAKRAIGQQYDQVLRAADSNRPEARGIAMIVQGDPLSSTVLARKAANKGYLRADGSGDVEAYIAAMPDDAGHWLRSALDQAARGATGREKVALKGTVEQLDALLDTNPGYAAARKAYGTEMGVDDATEWGENFVAAARNEYSLDLLMKSLNGMTPDQRRVALASTRNNLNTYLRSGPEDASARISNLTSSGVLDALGRLGDEGKALADDLRFIRREQRFLSSFDPEAQSRSVPNALAVSGAQARGNSPLANAAQAVGQPGSMTQDVVISTVAGTPLPIMTAKRGLGGIIQNAFGPRIRTLEDQTRFYMSRPGNVPSPPESPDFTPGFARQQTVPSQNAFTRSQGLPQAKNDLVSGGLYGGVGAFSGNFVDYNGDGVTDGQDMLIGAGVGAAGGAATSRIGSKVGVPKGKGSRWDAETPEEFVQRVVAETKPKPITRAATMEEFNEAQLEANRLLDTFGQSKGQRVDTEVMMPGTDGPDQYGITRAEALTMQLMRAQGLDPDPVLKQIHKRYGTNAEMAKSEENFHRSIDAIKRRNEDVALDGGEPDELDERIEYLSNLSMKDVKPNAPGLGNAFAQSVLGGAGGSAYGSQNDINGDGVIDEQDVFLGSAAGTVGVPVAMGVAGRVGNAFAPGARVSPPQRSLGISRPEPPITTPGPASGGNAASSTAFDAHVKADELAQSLRDGGFDVLSVRKSQNREGGKSAYIKIAGVADEIRLSDHSANMDFRPGQKDWYGPTDASAADELRASIARGDAKRAAKSSPEAMLEAYEAPFKERYLAASSDQERRQILREMYPQSKPNSRERQLQAVERWTGPTRSMGFGAGGGRKPPPDSPEAITEAVRGIARQTPATPPDAPLVAPRGNMRGVLQAPERIPPASPMADQVPPPLPPRPVSNRVPTSNMPNATEIGLAAGTGAAIGGAFLMEKANDPATFGLASFDQLPPEHPLRDPNYRRMALMAQMQPQQSQNAFASARQ